MRPTPQRTQRQQHQLKYEHADNWDSYSFSSYPFITYLKQQQHTVEC